MILVHALNMKLKLLFGAMVTSAIMKFFIKCFGIIFLWEMLTSALRVVVKNRVKKSFYEKRKENN